MEPLLGVPAGWLREIRRSSTRTARDAGGREHRRDRYQPGARASGVVSGHWYVPGRISGDAAAHHRIASASIRQAYGFEWRARDVRAFARCTALLRASRRLLPPLAREWPVARRLDLPDAALIS